jgi:hypothetical protein
VVERLSSSKLVDARQVCALKSSNTLSGEAELSGGGLWNLEYKRAGVVVYMRRRAHFFKTRIR